MLGGISARYPQPGRVGKTHGYPQGVGKAVDKSMAKFTAVNGKVIHREQNYSCVIRDASGKIATLCVAAIWLRSGGGAGATGVVGWGDGLLPISDLSGGYKHYLLLKRSLITDL